MSVMMSQITDNPMFVQQFQPTTKKTQMLHITDWKNIQPLFSNDMPVNLNFIIADQRTSSCKSNLADSWAQHDCHKIIFCPILHTKKLERHFQNSIIGYPNSCYTIWRIQPKTAAAQVSNWKMLCSCCPWLWKMISLHVYAQCNCCHGSGHVKDIWIAISLNDTWATFRLTLELPAIHERDPNLVLSPQEAERRLFASAMSCHVMSCSVYSYSKFMDISFWCHLIPGY